MKKLFLWCIFCVVALGSSTINVIKLYGQQQPLPHEQGVVELCADSLAKHPNNFSITEKPWLFHSGDDASWSRAGVADTAANSGWVLRLPFVSMKQLSEQDWTGIGWYRVRLRVDTALYGKPLALRVSHRGASEVYFDGQRVGGFGVVSPDLHKEQGYRPNGKLLFYAIQRPPMLASNEAFGMHVLAVRYSDTRAWARFKRPIAGRQNMGFVLDVGFPDKALAAFREEQTWQKVMMFLVGALGVLALLHTLLFAFSRKKEYLQYTFFTAGLTFFFLVRVVENLMHTNVDVVLFLQFSQSFFITFAFISCIAFFYTVFYATFPKRIIWLWAMFPSIHFFVLARLFSWADQLAFAILTFTLSAEIMRVIVLAIIRRRAGASVLGIGGLLFVGQLGLLLLMENNFVPTFVDGGYLLVGSMVSIPIAMSIYLSRSVAATNKELAAKLEEVQQLTAKTIDQEVQQKLLEADNERKTAELEEARKLQLSMLPQSMPQIEGVDIAMFMQTATEVGGDYYDYFVDADGALTIAIGDATGHGVKAGTMVAATKSLFAVMAQDTSPVGTLKPTSPALKRMNMRSMFMALMVVKYKNGKGLIANAGMPSAVVFRAVTQSVEEILIKSMPLGTMANFPYQEREFTLASGDVLIMMSDGFPERFNTSEDILGYDIAQQACTSIHGMTAQQIVAHLVQHSERWADGAPLNDDMTFVVMRAL